MKKKKNLYEQETIDVLLDQDQVIVKQTPNEMFFHIGYQTTDDVAEAVSIMFRNISDRDPVWTLKVKNKHNINIQNTLYWLSGGDEEWGNLENYNQPWNECIELYEKEFEDVIIEIIENSVTLNDIKIGFKKKLNMFKMYDFALSKNLIK